MAKLKPATGKRKAKAANWSKAVPCLIIIVAGTVLLMLLLSAILSSK